MTRALGDGMSNLERLAVWKKDILLGGLGDRTKMWIVLARLPSGVRRSRSPKASTVLQRLQMTAHRILRKDLRLRPYKLQVVQKLTPGDKQLRSLFTAHVCV
jgi:hypothetical protein